jgi:hypothetical protein
VIELRGALQIGVVRADPGQRRWNCAQVRDHLKQFLVIVGSLA